MITWTGTGLPSHADGPVAQWLSSARVARLATVRADGTPHLVPITFAVRADTIVTAVDAKPKRTNDLQRLRNLRAEPRVAVLVDHYDDDWSTLWWIRVDGIAAEATEGDADCIAGIDALVTKYEQYRAHRPDGPLVVVRAVRWSAWSAATTP